MLKKEEAIEEGRVKKKLKEKRSSVWRSTGAPGPHWGARTVAHHTLAPWGRPWVPPGPHSAEKIKLTNLGFFTPYICFLTPPSLPPSSPRSKIPSSLKVFIISLNPHSNPPYSTPNLSSFLSSTTISTPFLPPTFSNLHLLPWQHPWMSLNFHLL